MWPSDLEKVKNIIVIDSIFRILHDINLKKKMATYRTTLKNVGRVHQTKIFLMIALYIFTTPVHSYFINISILYNIISIFITMT
jgi:hypothetical protein